MPNYKKLYYMMFHANEDAARLLLEAQSRAEEEFLRTDFSPLILPPNDPVCPSDVSLRLSQDEPSNRTEQ